MTEITETYASKSSPGKSYTCICHAADGKLACNCRGWATKKLGKARTCTHCDKLVSFHGLVTFEKGDYRYATPPGQVLPTLQPSGLVSPKRKVVAAQSRRGASQPSPEPVTPVVGRPRFNVIPETDDDVAMYVNPMLATPFPDGQTLANFCAGTAHMLWAMEEKFDGHRVVVTVNEGVVKAWSRPRAGKEALVRTLPDHMVVAFSALPTATYDGELMIPGGRSYNVTDGKFAGTEIFVVFDILSMLGQSTLKDSYDKRRSYLTEIFSARPSLVITLAESSEPSVATVQKIWDRDGEGAILKRRAATYVPGARSKDFIKVKALHTAVMTVTGFKAGKLGPHSTVELRGADGSTTTVKTLDNDALRAFAVTPGSFIGRKLRIEYQERTPDGSYRHPRWDRWENE
jgi:hypothetical protein